MTWVCFVALALSCLAATAAGLTHDAKNQRNRDLDLVILDVIQQHGSDIEPVRIPDHGYNFHHKWRRVNVSGEAKFFDIKLSGLSTVRRSGDCFVERTRIGNYLITANLALGPLKYDMKGTVNLFGVGPKRHFYGRMVHLDADMTIMYSAQTDRFSLKSYTVKEINGLTLQMAQRWYSISDKVINRTIKTFLDQFETISRHTIESAFSKMLQASVNGSKILRRMVENEISQYTE